MSDIKNMNKSQKNRARKIHNKITKTTEVSEVETLELKEKHTLIKSVSVENKTSIETPQSKQEYMDKALSEAQRLWDVIKKKGQDPEFIALPDKEKINSVSLEFHEFHREFPIVSRYLVCMGQYSSKAFKKYLIKVQNTKAPEIREKGYVEDQWVRRQADYVRYLWESYQRGHYNNSEAQTIWQNAYAMLKKEFLDFKDMHESIEKDLENEKRKNKAELIKELFKRLSTGEQTLEEKNMMELLEVMRIQLLQQRKEKLNMQIKNTVNIIEPTYECFGSVEPLPDLPMPDPFLAQ